ncbi:MAG: hypothetical protein KGJ05_06420, partial [Alphaproteobacteria bacterium]|nr:hypothetical protein [Alphaproteobacteria bacterium]
RASYKYYRRGQDAYSGSNFAQFNVCMDPTSIQTLGTGPVASETLCQNGTPVVKLGPDTPRQANQFNNHILNLQGNATLTLGTHSIKVEVDHYYSKLYNLFVFGTGGLAGTGGPQGLYYFNSMQDFVNQQANELVYENSTTGAKTDGYVNWAYQINTGGLQDTWKIKPNLTVTAGIRYDRYGADNSIQANQNFATRFQTLYPGLTNTATLDGRDKLQPRFGFNWTPKSNLRISGGIGLFAGGFSDVFVSNNYSNSGTAINGTGATLVGIDLVRTATGCIDRTTGQNPGAAVCNAGLNGVTGSSIPAVVSQYLSTNTGVLANALTNSLDPNFKMPAQWKYNLSANWRPDLTNLGLGKGWTLRGDILFSDAQEAVRWTDLRAQPLVVGGVVQLAPDGRARYGGALNENGTLVQPGANYDMQLTNTTQGQARVFAVGLYKDFKDISFNVDYTHQNVKDVAGTLFSSTVGSAYGSVAALDPNGGGAYGRSAFEVTNEIRAGFEIHHAFFGDNLTTLGFNAEFRSGQPFSIEFGDYTTNNVSGRPNVFGTVQNNFSQLFYVPNFAGAASNPCPTSGKSTFGIVTFADAATCSGVYNLVTQTKLGKYQGQIAPKNVLTGPSYNKVDLHFAQQLPFFHHSKITALFDIENFLNLLNTNWGSYQAYADTAVVRVACTGAAVGGQTCPGYLYSSYSAPKTISYSKFSLYTIRAGVRFDF